MEAPFAIGPDVHVLTSYVPIPTIGQLPNNAFLVRGAQPYLVDTGLIADCDAFVAAVEGVMDPADLRWIYVTHTDPDHIGALMALLDRAPQAKVVTTFVGFAKLQLGLRLVPPARIRLCNPGERLDLGDRTLIAGRPPVFDAPETTVLYDAKLRALFSADSFGGPLEAPVRTANELTDAGLEASQILWAVADAPWIHHIDRDRFAGHLRQVIDLDPEWILSAHLPPARNLTRQLCDNLRKAPDAAPFAAPDQPAFEAMLRDLEAEAGGRS